VRKALGQHEIATVQTTSIDQATQAVSLTTVLAHSSGEWIASDWPVCALSEMAAPRRMGAALTYARRYALFALVGIAGEEDLDAPDLAGRPATNERPSPKDNGSNAGKPKGKDAPLGSFCANRRRWSPPKQVLEPERSAALRDQFVSELVRLRSPEEVTDWAQRALGAKNTLRGADAAAAAFASRMAELASLGSAHAPLPSSPAASPDPRRPRKRRSRWGASRCRLHSAPVLSSARGRERRDTMKLAVRSVEGATSCDPTGRHRLRWQHRLELMFSAHCDSCTA
jgi:hypothetical protein